MNKKNKKPFHIAILGTRGVPASYGGFETFAEELSLRLVREGTKVTVYNRHPFGKSVKLDDFNGVKRISTGTIFHKYLETPLHSLSSFIDVLFYRKYDAIILCNAANAPFAWLGRLKGIPVYTNVDGIERKRAKWNFLGRLWYMIGEACSVLFSTKIICDAEVINEYYKKTYKTSGAVIAYGAEVKENLTIKTLQKFNLTERNYIFYLSRLEPENNALGVIEAYVKLKTDVPLVIVGDAPYADEYKEKLRAAANQNVIFTGYQFGDAYHELRNNCLFYIQATEVGGTHPALVEGMAYGNCIIANGTPENLEVLGDAGLFYKKNDFDELSKIMKELLFDTEQVKSWSVKAKKRAKKHYSWDIVVKQYKELLGIFNES